MDKNTRLAFILIFLVLVISYFMQPPKQHKVIEKKIDTTIKNQTVTASLDNNNDSNSNITTLSPINQKKDSLKKDIALKELKDIFVETSLYSAIFSTDNGALKSFKLKSYKQREDSSKLVDLIRPGLFNLYTRFDFKDSRLNKAILAVDKDSLVLSESNPTGKIVFSLQDELGNILFTKSIFFSNDKYSFDIDIEHSNLSSYLNSPNLDIDWKNGINFTETTHRGGKIYTNSEEQFSFNYYKIANKEREEIASDEDDLTVNGNIEWASTRTKYFETFIFGSEQGFSNYSHFKGKMKGQKTSSDLGFSLNLKDKDSKKFSVFVGPMSQDILESYNLEFESTLNWGWDIVKPFAWIVLWALKTIHIFISNYGLVIIILSILINLLLTPFYVKSFKSSIAMKKIQPLIKGIQKQYKNDLQRQQQETMLLDKKHKVNPLGACSPALLPMPVLYGLFIVFRTTIELRNANFGGWITDLSLPEVMFQLPFSIPMYGDNFGILPLLMGFLMYLQSKDSMSGMDSKGDDAASDAMAMNAKMMKYFMPIFMVLMFNNFASGLILYYTVGSVYRYFQMRYVKNQLQ